MKIFTIILFIVFFSCNSEEESEPIDVLKRNAIPIQDLTQLNNKIYNKISAYDVIMVGEMHGTKEPAEFVYGLSKLIAKREDKVILALEIPPSEMEGFSESMSQEQIKQLYFFAKENRFGRNCKIYLDLIHDVNQKKKIRIEFIDSGKYGDRDSSMYVEVLQIKKTYPNTKIVSLTGNVHNWLIPYKDYTKFGGYLMNDTINFEPKKIMSINHIFNKGTMFNRIRGELKVHVMEGTESNIYNENIAAEMFLSKRIDETQKQYTHFLYTEKVTHSEKIEQ